MCGIVGYVGGRNATEILIDGLRRLEYRGYDSAGIAVRGEDDVLIVRAQGKLSALQKKIQKKPPQGVLGIGHTRWATHGRPSETNAHPHKAGPIIVVHNGIIENYVSLRSYLTKKGHTIHSETDTELVCHLIQQRMYDGFSMEKAFYKALKEIKGSYALVVIHKEEPDRLYIARNGSPLVVGVEEGEKWVASDVPALLPYTRRVLFLEDGDVGILTRNEVQLTNAAGVKVKRTPRTITWSQTMSEKGGYKHFMQKEIFEQPRAIADTLAGRIGENKRKIYLDGIDSLFGNNGHFPFERLYLLACGTSYHAALVGQYFLEELSRLPARAELASEFRYRRPMIDKKTLVIAISQSGETADTLAAVKDAKEKGARIVTVCNVIDSSLPRASHATFYTHAGPEIGVASTKAFTTQVLLLLLLSLRLGQIRGFLSPTFLKEAIEWLNKLPQQMEKVLKQDSEIRTLAKRYASASHFLYFGRGVNYPIALEGSLKLKEISYIHAEGYAAGEMKHGPIALIDRGMPVIVLVPQDKSYEKTLSNIEEVRARGAQVIGIGTQGDKHLVSKCQRSILLPKAPWYITPLLMTLPLQQFAYHVAAYKGTDVDQPRNLAKSVTVE